MTELVSQNNLSGQSNEMVLCIAWMESSFDPDTQSKKSSARGLMQILKKSVVEDLNMVYDKSLFDPVINIRAGTKFLGLKFKWLKGDKAKALASYGTGKSYSDKIIKCEKCMKNKCKSSRQDCLDDVHLP